MDNLKPDPKGIARLFLYLILGTVCAMLLPHGFRAVAWTLRMLEDPPPPPLNPELVRLFVWTVVAGLAIGIAIRLARRI